MTDGDMAGGMTLTLTGRPGKAGRTSSDNGRHQKPWPQAWSRNLIPPVAQAIACGQMDFLGGYGVPGTLPVAYPEP